MRQGFSGGPINKDLTVRRFTFLSVGAADVATTTKAKHRKSTLNSWWQKQWICKLEIFRPKFCISRSVRHSIFCPLLYVSRTKLNSWALLQNLKLTIFLLQQKKSVVVLLCSSFFLLLEEDSMFPFSPSRCTLFIPFGTLGYAVLRYWQFSMRYLDNLNLDIEVQYNAY